MQRKRVMIDARMCAGRHDGVTRYVTRLIQQLSRHTAVAPVALCGEAVPEEFAQAGVECHVSGFGAAHRPAHRRLLWEQTRLPELIRGARVDLYHATWNTGIPLRCPVPAVLTLHDLIPLNDVAAHFPSRLHRWSYQLSLRTALGRAARVITVSDYVRRECIERMGVPTERVQAVLNGADGPGHPRARHPVALDSPTEGFVLYVGGAEPRKNIAGLLRGLDRLWQQASGAPELWVTGSLDRQCPAAREVYATMQHAERVRFLGAPDDAAIARLMGTARALLLLSTAEGFGLPALEAMAHGCPVIVSNRTALPEVVETAGLIVDPDDPQAVADAILRIVHDENLRAELVRRGLDRAGQLTWARTAAQTVTAYELALGGAGAHQPDVGHHEPPPATACGPRAAVEGVALMEPVPLDWAMTHAT